MVGLVRLVSHRLQHQTSFRQAPGIKLVRLDKPHELARFFIRNQAVEQVVGQVRTVFLLCKLRVCAGCEQAYKSGLVGMNVHQMACMTVVDFGVAQRTVPAAKEAILGTTGLVAKLAVDDMLVFQRDVRPVVLVDRIFCVAKPARDAVAQPHTVCRWRHNCVKVGHFQKVCTIY